MAPLVYCMNNEGNWEIFKEEVCVKLGKLNFLSVTLCIKRAPKSILQNYKCLANNRMQRSYITDYNNKSIKR